MGCGASTEAYRWDSRGDALQDTTLARSQANRLSRKMFDALYSGDVEGVRRRLDNGDDPNAPHRDGRSPLMISAGYDHVNVCEVLLNMGANVNAVNLNGATALMHAVAYNHLDVLRLLLRQPNVDTSIRAKKGTFAGRTCMGIATAQRHEEVRRTVRCHAAAAAAATSCRCRPSED
eukprot:COSAG01_NODE_1482_length_10160_cov_12.513567_12_plen_176_part_00